jgi:hypothetical protein
METEHVELPLTRTSNLSDRSNRSSAEVQQSGTERSRVKGNKFLYVLTCGYAGRSERVPEEITLLQNETREREDREQQSPGRHKRDRFNKFLYKATCGCFGRDTSVQDQDFVQLEDPLEERQDIRRRPAIRERLDNAHHPNWRDAIDPVSRQRLMDFIKQKEALKKSAPLPIEKSDEERRMDHWRDRIAESPFSYEVVFRIMEGEDQEYVYDGRSLEDWAQRIEHSRLFQSAKRNFEGMDPRDLVCIREILHDIEK